MSDIVDGNGEIINVSADDTADGQTLYRNGERLVVADEDAFAVFTLRTGASLTDLDEARSVLTMGDLGSVAGLGLVPDIVFSQIDAQQLRVGTFPEAQALATGYLEHFYKSGAEAVERVWHGIDTASTVAADTMAAYTDTDGNVAADVGVLVSEFDSSTGTLTASHLAEIQTRAAEPEAPSSGADGGREDDSPRIL
ncbi:hypothetical protein GCM10009830_24550 [Glycomyces endophyticus]|uniref:Uncharacterized protein n=1 Tax=Glycomyces endophyticus TaxID=480996 RepID=A0ABN2GU33_9ACTN